MTGISPAMQMCGAFFYLTEEDAKSGITSEKGHMVYLNLCVLWRMLLITLCPLWLI